MTIKLKINSKDEITDINLEVVEPVLNELQTVIVQLEIIKLKLINDVALLQKNQNGQR